MDKEKDAVYCDEEAVVPSKIKIASDVVGRISAIAALEVEGVSAMGNNITTEILGRVGFKNLSKNVHVEVLGHDVKIDLTLTVDYGLNIPAISQKIQLKVKQAVEGMTGLNVSSVNVRIAGVNQNV